MRWDVIGLVIGWTLRIFALPLAVVGAYSVYADGWEFAIQTYANCLSNRYLSQSVVVSLSVPRVMKLVAGKGQGGLCCGST